MSATISHLSTEYVRVPISTVEGEDLTGDAVQMAFTPQGYEPVGGDWTNATWTTGQRAQLLVGPAGTTSLTVGTWLVWARVTDSPELPVLRAGTVTVY